MAAPNILPSYLNIFNPGSLNPNSFANIASSIATIKQADIIGIIAIILAIINLAIVFSWVMEIRAKDRRR